MWYLCFDIYDQFGGGNCGGMGDCDLRTKDFHKARRWLESNPHRDIYRAKVYIYDVTHDKRIYIEDIRENPDNYKGNRPSYL